MSDLTSSNDVVTNGVNGRTGNKFWCKCESCIPMESSTGACLLPTTSWDLQANIFKNIVFVCLYIRSTFCADILGKKTLLASYLISTQCWSLANQNKSFVSLQTFPYYLLDLFLYRDVFCGRIFSKEHPIGFRGSVIIEKQYLIIWITRSSHSQVLKNLSNGGKFYKTHFLWI